MSKQNEIGRKGESIAHDYLASAGFEILETNWRFGHAEIDLVVKEGDILVFVEVKTRSSTSFGKPEEFIDDSKEEHIAHAAAAYMRIISHEWEYRFDVVAIVLKRNEKYTLHHIKDAFFPGLL